MNFENLSELSYRELQAKAKCFGIAANKKKEFLIEALLEEQAKQVVGETVVESSIESTEAEAEAECTMEAEEVVEVVAEVECDIENEECEAEAVEEVEEDLTNINESDELLDMFSNLKLKGIPTPTGKKTVFESVDDDSTPVKINWGTEAQNDAENCNPQKPKNFISTPKGKHTVFASPELKVGNAVHWTYAEYDQASAKEPVAEPTTAVKFRFASSDVVNSQTPKKMANPDERMSFWLSKGPKTPR